MKRLRAFTPYLRLSTNPLFVTESRYALRGETAQKLVSYTWQCLLTVFGMVLFAWAMLALLNVSEDVLILFIAVLAGFSLLMALALDFNSMTAALGSISGEIAAKHWDLLRLTSLSSEQIALAKHGIAQIRTWRLTIFLMTLRAAASLSIVLTFALLLYRSRPLNLFAAIDVVLLGFGYGWVILFIMAVYIVEPYWRMHAITALAIAISARTKTPALSLWAAVAALLAFWLAQGVISALLAAEFYVLFGQLIQFDQPTIQMSACAPLIFLGLSLGIIYGFYAVVQSWSLHHAEDWIAQIS